MLYTETDNVLLATEFTTSAKDIKNYLDPAGFDVIEHQIFSKFIVIISEVISEYDKEVHLTRARPINGASTAVCSQHSGTIIDTNKAVPLSLGGKTAIPIERKVAKKRQLITTDQDINKNTNELALKFNKPFKPPRLIADRKDTTPLKPNRPSIRDSHRVKLDNPPLPESKPIQKKIKKITTVQKPETHSPKHDIIEIIEDVIPKVEESPPVPKIKKLRRIPTTGSKRIKTIHHIAIHL